MEKRHKRLICPHKAGTSGETAGPSTAAVNGTEDALPPVVEKRDAQIVKQPESVTDNGYDEEVVAETELNEKGVPNDDMSGQVYGEAASANVDILNDKEN